MKSKSYQIIISSMSKLFFYAFVLLLLIIVSFPISTHSEILECQPDNVGDPPNGGQCIIERVNTFINNFPNENNTLNLAGGVYTLVNPVSPIGVQINIIGSGPQASDTSILGNNTFQIFKVLTQGNLTLNKLFITNGFDGLGGDGGGAIHNKGTLNIFSSVVAFSNSESSVGGGGVANIGGTANIFDSAITLNKATIGGGIINRRQNSQSPVPTMIVNNVNILDNTSTSGDGGGIYNLGGALTLLAGNVSRNTSAASGGGVLNNGTFFEAGSTTMDVNGVVIDNNTATNGSGGGLANFSGNVDIFNSVISINEASSGGGVSNIKPTNQPDMQSPPAVMRLELIVIADNVAKLLDGGGISNISGQMVLIGGQDELSVGRFPCTIRDNTAARNGGGLSNFALSTPADMTIDDLTLVCNFAGSTVDKYE